ncbi:MAG TPA: ABC transporter ATP-binding protein [Vitreimonas sp.]|jgi:subfamily B ATP-binding cassette protein MsbA|nr:ABC transporter ATP-binding protein [Vitreimonas sp.]
MPAQQSLFARLWRDYVARYKSEIAVLVPVLVLVAASGVSYAGIVDWATNAINTVNWPNLEMAVAAAIGLAALRAFSMWAQSVLSQDIALKVLRDLQGAMFGKLLGADFARFSREEPGRLVSRFTNDINVVSEALVRGGQTAVRDTLTLIGAIGYMFYFDWVLTLVVLGVFAFAAGPMQAIAKSARQRTHAAQQQISALSAVLFESFGAARFVKTYGLEAHETERARVGFDKRRKLQLKLARNRAITVPLLEMIGGLAFGIILLVAGWRITHHDMTLGALMGIVTAFATMTPSARAVGQFNTLFNEARAALERIFGLIDEPNTINDKPDAKPLAVSKGEVSFDHVGFAYADAPALSDVSFTVAPGETIALVGPSGAGKSTIFNLLPRLYDATAGSVRIDGQDVRDVTIASLRASISLVAQEASLFNDTVRANIALGRAGATHAEIEEAARHAAAHDFITALPNGYDTIVGDRGSNLSGGERQRVALARAFLRDAPILLLDEATSALDAESEAKVQEALARLSKGRTVLVIAHRLSTVRDADRILALDGGRIVEVGRHEDLIAKNGLYARLSRLQFQTGALDAG